MSLLDLLDHTADVVRPAEPPDDDPYAAEREVYVVVSPDARCAFWPLVTPIQDYGAGEAPQGRTSSTFELPTDIAERDVVVVKTGPESGKRWRVLTYRSPGRRFGRGAHHHEAELEPFTGMLPGYDDPEAGS